MIHLTDIITINRDLGTADTERAIELPSGVYELRVQARGAADLKVAWLAGNSGSNYFTVKSGTVYRIERFGGLPKGGTAGKSILYVQSPVANTVIEIECLK